MDGLLILWYALVVSLFIFLCFRCDWMFYVIGILPIFLTGTFFLLRHFPVEEQHKLTFFSGFKVGAHVGLTGNSPENPIAYFEKAVNGKAQLLEFDVQLSEDLIPMVILRDGPGRTATDVKFSTAEANHVRNNNQKKRAALIEVALWCVEKNTKMLINVESSEPELIGQLVAIVQTFDLYSSVVVVSYNPLVLFSIKSFDPRILTGLRSSRSHYVDVMEPTNYLSPWIHEIADDITFWAVRFFVLPRFLGVEMLLMDHKEIDHELVREARQNDIKTVAFTVNDETVMKFALKSLEIPILTDFPAVAVRYVR